MLTGQARFPGESQNFAQEGAWGELADRGGCRAVSSHPAAVSARPTRDKLWRDELARKNQGEDTAQACSQRHGLLAEEALGRCSSSMLSISPGKQARILQQASH